MMEFTDRKHSVHPCVPFQRWGAAVWSSGVHKHLPAPPDKEHLQFHYVIRCSSSASGKLGSIGVAVFLRCSADAQGSTDTCLQPGTALRTVPISRPDRACTHNNNSKNCNVPVQVVAVYPSVYSSLAPWDLQLYPKDGSYP
jgi:hypothetical protein